MIKALDSIQLPKAQVPLRSSYLLANCIIRKNQPGSENSLPEIHCLGDSSDLSINYRNVLGDLLKWRRYPDLRNEKTTETQRRIKSFYWESTAVHDFIVICIVAKLTQCFLDELLTDALVGYDFETAFNTKINELVSDLLPPLAGERVDNFNEHQAVSHILYFEPNVQLISNTERENWEKVLPLMEGFRLQFGKPKSALLSTILEDILFLPELGYGGSRRSCVAVRLYPFKSDQSDLFSDTFQIPLIPMSFLNHVAICTIKSFCSHMLTSLLVSTNHFWELGKSWSNFVSYRSQYMKSRLEAEIMILKLEELEASIRRLLPTFFIYGERYIEFIDKITLEDQSSKAYIRSLSTIIKNEKQKTNDLLSKNIRITKTRMSMLDGFLHDAAVADSTSTNLRLAKSVEKLTWVVIFIALLTFIATLIPDTIKQTAMDRVFKGTSIEWLFKGGKAIP